jgi:hypothetical protein
MNAGSVPWHRDWANFFRTVPAAGGGPRAFFARKQLEAKRVLVPFGMGRQWT